MITSWQIEYSLIQVKEHLEILVYCLEENSISYSHSALTGNSGVDL